MSENLKNHRPRRVYSGMWGAPEIVAVGLGLIAMLGFILVLAFLVFPSQRELENSKTRRNEIENELTTVRARYGTMTSTQDRVGELGRSVDDFEVRVLRNENDAKVALYQRLNGLISALGLTNTSGPDYAPLEVDAQGRTQTSDDQSGRSKLISVFPGVFVTVTVDGTYQNLRRFVREIETGNEFIVISAIELEPSETKEKKDDPTKPPTNSSVDSKIDRGKTYGDSVTLRIELAGYYRRANFNPEPASTEAPR